MILASNSRSLHSKYIFTYLSQLSAARDAWRDDRVLDESRDWRELIAGAEVGAEEALPGAELLHAQVLLEAKEWLVREAGAAAALPQELINEALVLDLDVAKAIYRRRPPERERRGRRRG